MATLWTEPAQNAVDRAARYADSEGGVCVTSQHILLALIEQQTFARDILIHLGVDLLALRAEVSHRGVVRRRSCANVFLAADEAAQEMGSDRVATEHLLLGILREERHHVSRTLWSLGVDYQRVRTAIADAAAHGELRPMTAATPRPPATPLSEYYSHAARQVLDAARWRASHFAEKGVEPEDLLFALLQRDCRHIHAALRNLGLDPVRWRGEEEIRALSYGTSFAEPPSLSDGTRRVLESAEARARRLCVHAFGPEEMFIALIEIYPSLFEDHLKGTPVRLSDLRHEVLDAEGVDARWIANTLSAEDYSTDAVLEQLTPQARRVMVGAREEAWERGDDHLGAEHLLLSLSRPGNGGAAAVLEHMGATHTRVREGLDRLLGPPREGPFVDPLPPSPTVEDALRVARKEAERMGHPRIGTEALLMGLLWQRECTAAKALEALEVTLLRTRLKVGKIYDAKLEYDPAGATSPLTCRARGILLLAQRRARESNLRVVDEKLLLAAILAQQGGLAIRALERMGVDLDALSRDQAGRRAEGTRTHAFVPPELTPEMRRLLDCASGLADGRGHARVGSGEILVAFSQEADLETRNALAALGITPSRLAAALAEVEAAPG